MKLIKEIKPAKVAIVEEKGKTFIKKICGENELFWLQKISKLYHEKKDDSTFHKLYVPAIEKADGNILYMEHLKGEMIKWSEHPEKPGYGGFNLPLGIVEDITTLILELGLLVPGYHHGDLQFRNMIFMDSGQIGIYDFEGSNTGYNSFDGEIAYLWMLTWINKDFQKLLISVAQHKLMLKRYAFRAHLIKKITDQRKFWKENKNLFNEMSKLLISVFKHYNEIWDGNDY